MVGGIVANEAGLREFVDQLQSRTDVTETEKKDILQSLLDIIKKALEKIKEFLSAGQVTGVVREMAQMEATEAQNIIRLLTDALDASAAAVASAQDGTTVTIAGAEGGVRFSFNNTKSGMANDELLPYDDEWCPIKNECLD